MINAETGISYKGEVKLTYKIGDKTIRVKKFNVGWSPLFRLFSLVLTGNITNEQLDLMKPTYVDLKYLNNTHWDSCLYSRIPVTPSFISESDSRIPGGLGYVSVFAITISYSNLNQALITGFNTDTEPKTETALFLLSGEPYNNVGEDADAPIRLASLGVDPKSIQDMLPGSQVIVEWTMKFYNA